jgi:uncharacterized membrane protein
MRSYGLGSSYSLGRFIVATPNLVAAINVVVAGVLAALVADTLGAQDAADVAVGVVAALAAAAGLGALGARSMTHVRRAHRPRFPA